MKILLRFAPDQAGALWLGLLITFLILGNSRRIFCRRNLFAVLLMLPALPLIDIHKWEPRLQEGMPFLLTAAFTGLYFCTALMAAIALKGALGRLSPLATNLNERSLVFLAAVIVFINLAVVIGYPSSDAGMYTNLGALRWRETGIVPYADVELRGPEAPAHGAAATYGPLLYVAHMPLQILLGDKLNAPDKDPGNFEEYVRPSDLASRLTCLLFHIGGLVALFGIGKRLADSRTALTLVALYAGSSYVIGMGGGHGFESIGGLTYISHIAPVSMVLLAFWALGRPLVAGICLAIGAGALFWPAFLFPTFAGWYFWRGKGLVPFIAGFGGVGLGIAALVIGTSVEVDGMGPIKLFMSSTLEHQEGFNSQEYGKSLFSFWGVHENLAAFWQKPLFGSSAVLKPTFLCFISLVLASFFLVRRRSVNQLALLIAAQAAAIQLWKTHAGGTYVEWYYPFLLIGFLALPTKTEENTTPAMTEVEATP